MPRHAEIAGAGFSGLTAALALLKRGWTVRIHERTPFVRSEGFAVVFHKNALCVMEALGVRERILARSIKIHRRMAKDQSGRILMEAPSSSHRISRQQIVSVLAEDIQSLGGELLTDSEVAGADRSGELILKNGRRLRADLVIGADGYNSRVRDSLGMHFRHELLDHGAMRLVIPRSEEERDAEPEGCGTGYEYWSGTRRVTYSPCSPDEVYLALTCVSGDEDGMAVPVRVDSWQRSFPLLSDVFDRVAHVTDWDRVRWVKFQTIKLDHWVHGKVVILGDAAHAMPPNLGQGGGCAMMNAHSLAVLIEQDDNLERALSRWEKSERPIIEHTQRWMKIYGAVALWPRWLRALTFDIVTHSGFMQRHLYRAANRVPPGCPSVVQTQ